jgi:acetyl esterase/lipase
VGAHHSAEILTSPPPPPADVRIAYGPEPLQFGDLRLPRGGGPHPLVAVVHGGYWQAIYNLTHAGHLCVDLAAHGVATWNIEYRRIGDPGGDWPGPLDDVVLALDQVSALGQSFPLELERVVAAGHSAGGHLALLGALKTATQLRGVISLAGVVDPNETDRRGDDRGLTRRLLGGAPNELPGLWWEASPRARLPLGFRYVLACGTADAQWGPNLATAAAAREAGDDVELLELPGAGHFELVDPLSAEWPLVRAKLLALLGMDSAASER